ncbi:hypothetical protein FEM03_23805 [Phragmitibacter flavus]|uniref:Glycosyl hydrolase family 67 n=1 Tax=Phragmitibacter flavus TaxID=2576071 RepID=A0A5R8K793_9BACT|nr:hypothetical protein [Phragmitibacter flavus]TLD68236.1 hypothetical protein FEM03_23805 [Phragmitibacter flavus]
MPNTEQLYLIDAIGPFFRGYDKRTINWSKLPWENLCMEGPEREAQWTEIRRELDVFCDKVAKLGFNAVSLDDVTHLADDVHYELETRALIVQWRTEFKKCFEVAKRHGLQVFITMDVFNATPAVREHLRDTRRSVESFLAELLDRFFTDFPELAGVIIRIGEADGRDVKDHFLSELHLRNSSEANRFLRALLPVFGKHQRKLVFRTWTVGAYQIGDLIWHRGTFAQVLRGVENHPSLIVSMKYGDSDFFRFLPLNENFFHHPVAKIVELQTRREYEGCGEYPSFVGWEYERYARELLQAKNMVGINVWCQTGGWVPFRRRAFLEDSAVWTDLNTHVTIRLFKEGQLVEDAVREFALQRGCDNWRALLELLRLSDEVINELLYVKEFAQQNFFFRRVRVPPMLQVYWNNIFISHSVKKMLGHFVEDKPSSLRAAQRALDSLEQMKSLAAEAGMPVHDIEFMADTFGILALAREYCLTPFTEDVETRLRAAKKAYKVKYPKSGDRHRYRIKMNFKPFWLRYRQLAWAVAVLMRRKGGYRLVDRLFTLHGLSLIYRVIARRRPQWIPAFARDSAMGVDTIFK